MNADLHSFRNIKNLKVRLHPQFNLFIGKNGEGKTNFLEGLYFSINGQSFRTHQSAHMLSNTQNVDNSVAFVKTKIIRGLLEDQICATIQAGSKSFLLNDKKTSSVFLKSQFPSVLFSPESLMAIKEGPEFRRELLDDLVATSLEFGPETTADYKKALKTRNKILKDHPTLSPNLKDRTEALLESIHPSFMRTATLLTRARIELNQTIQSDFVKIFREITRAPTVDISVEYVISDQIANDWSTEQVYNAINQRSRGLRAAELSSGVTLAGPHKHDVRFLYNGKDSRFFCSQGQQRALILAFKITQIVYHRRTHEVSPILFLDDVLSELDSDKREYLLSFLRDHDSQTLITTTDISQLGNFTSDNASLFGVEQGQIRNL